jgi:hypothetical protein
MIALRSRSRAVPKFTNRQMPNHWFCMVLTITAGTWLFSVMRTPVALPPSSYGKERATVALSAQQQTIFVLNLHGQHEAVELAKKLAAKNGRIIVVRDAEGIEIATILPPTKH